MKLKKTLIFLLILNCCFFVSNITAQKKLDKKSVSKLSKTKKMKQPKTISGGVVNGKAIDLVAPIYPQAAKMTNVYGVVKVQVLIDVDGKVLTADIISGNPLLLNSCITAAMQSKFSPIQINREFVRISGFIHYNFSPISWNWLEIGYILQKPDSNYYTIEDLSKYFPFGFEEEIQLLNQKTENQNEIKNYIIASLQNKPSNNQKVLWLFSLGLTLGKIKKSCCRINKDLLDFAHNIRTFIQTKPENISLALVSKLEKFTLYAENPTLDSYNPNEESKIYQILRELEENFPTLGK